MSIVSSLTAAAAMTVATTTATAEPLVQPGDTHVWASVSAGILADFYGHTCGIQLDGTLWCWGSNDFGEVGVGDTVDRFKPAQVGTDDDWAVVSANGFGTCAVKTGGTMWCWGRDVAEAPLQIGAATTWTTVSVGASFQCGLQSDSSLWCWGVNSYGQLGQGDTVDRADPTKVVGSWRFVAALTTSTCAIKTGGSLWCWGDNEAGALGIGQDDRYVATPHQVGSATDWRNVGGGNRFACAIREPGSLWCWGDNQLGELGLGDRGIGTERFRPAQVGTDRDWAVVDAGEVHACAQRSGGALWCWGFNGAGQLGLGGGGSVVTRPHQVGSLTTWAGPSAGGSHTCSLQTDHSLWCWGDPTHGKLGVGNRTQHTGVPVQVGLPNGPTPVSYSLASVSAVSPTDVWAVGTRQRKAIVSTYIEHGDGAAWTQVPSVDPGPRISTLSAVSAVSDSDAWAVGSFVSGGTTHPLIEHWDGTRWTRSPISGEDVPGGRLVAVDARSATDAWAVGSVTHDFGYQDLLVEHWDGTGWTEVATDSPGWTERTFSDVTVLAADDVWVSGYGLKDEEAGMLPLTEHWNGSAWKLVAVPFKQRFANHFLRAVDATPDGDLWTVGDQKLTAKSATVTEHWTGSDWMRVTSPSPGVRPGSFLYDVAAQASDDLWAVGTYGAGRSLRPLVLHGDGSSWSQVAVPNPGGKNGTTLTSVSADASDDAWAVGYFDNGDEVQQIVEHWDGSAWTVVQKG